MDRSGCHTGWLRSELKNLNFSEVEGPLATALIVTVQDS